MKEVFLNGEEVVFLVEMGEFVVRLGSRSLCEGKLGKIKVF